ncbi:ABC transporter substrate-binding protein [Thermoclostridium caenicola]|uniref:ABC-type glycerol-3-phosphate transport system, substrate-binding protein n=1 Tax=Thermoclostridium caenicola TaxID=659425 RepID=A0A1M6AZ25_9FIRM|nr:ABC transporter substrate-binding protein [Thermoclostridium caenicola]SHI41706.1 ABC-type glycerol-3-phosphate transport system, substrate-binding protein [Thermoclostridium caenicola]
MKRILALVLSVAMLFTLAIGISGCGGNEQTPASPDSSAPAQQTSSAPADTSTPAPEVSDDPNVKVLNLWSFTDEVPKMMDKYKEIYKQRTGQDFPYEIKTTIIATTDGAYQPALDQALASGGADAPDIYCVESAFVLKYTQGDAANYAAAYKDLGIDVDRLLKESEIAQYTVDIGTRPSDGKLVGLGYQATGGAFIYRRSIAKDVWGTDDPAVIKDKIGPGWEKFFQAAEEVKQKGYVMLSSDGDLWNPVRNAAEKPWIVDGKLYIDPAREAFFDYAKRLKDNGYSNDTTAWTDAWYADMKDAGPKKVFGFFGPAWLINYVMAGNSGGSKPGEGTYGDWAICEAPVGFFWGGTWVLANKDTKIPKTVGQIIEWITLDSSETGLQYFWANGTLEGPGGTKDTVASGAVMKKSDGKLDFLAGQNMFDVFVPAGEFARGDNMTQYDETINTYFTDQVREYVNGNKTKEQAIADFKQLVADNLDVIVE